MLRGLFLVLCVVCLGVAQGCCIFGSGIPDGPEFDGPPVDPYHDVQSFSSDAAVNRMVTALSIQSIALFRGQVPVVKKVFSAKESTYNTLPDQVFHKLVTSGTIKSYFKGVTGDESYSLRSVIVTDLGVTLWSLELVDLNKKVVWEQRVKLDI